MPHASSLPVEQRPKAAGGIQRATIPKLLFAFLAACYSLSLPEANGQFGIESPGELTETIRVNEPDPALRTQLERVRVQLTENQWDEAIDLLRQIMDNQGERMVSLDDRRFVSLRDYGHLLLSGLPPAGLKIYRGKVDAQAKGWLETGLPLRKRDHLQRIVVELFASSHTDEALLALGEIALERGEYGAARGYWERISPLLRADAATPLWLKGSAAAQPAAWLAYPDTSLDLAALRARLVLVSIMEGAFDRAEIELAALVADYPDAKGRLAGREAPFRETLAGLLSAAKAWTPILKPVTATTFGGTPERSFVASDPVRLRRLVWSVPFFESWQANIELASAFRLPDRRVAESAQGVLSYYPLVVGELVVYHDLNRVYAFNLKSGKPAWPRTHAQGAPGEIARVNVESQSETHALFARALGVPRFAPSFHALSSAGFDRKRTDFTDASSPCYLFVRLGSHVTSRPTGSRQTTLGEIQVLDLSQQGKKVAGLSPENENWSFEGAPIGAGPLFYVAMRHQDVRPQQHVSCYELTTRSDASGTAIVPILRWRTFVCAAESPARGSADEITHNLLTLSDGTLYLNTNLGAVASLSAEDGRLQWLTTYPRAKKLEQAAHFFRDLNPCIYHRGTLYVAPTDSPHIMAFDALTGAVRWASPAGLADVMHLLGVAEGNLIVSGRQIWWLDAESGRIINYFPDHVQGSLGQGRGILVDDVVVWPTREHLYMFHQRQEPPTGLSAIPTMARQPIRLADYSQGLTGGNLVAAGEYALLATEDRLWAFGPDLDDDKSGKENAR